MKKARNVLLIILALLFIKRCVIGPPNLGGDSNYYLDAIDGDENMELCYRDKNGYGFMVIPSTVFAAGENKDFIIAKQHPNSNKLFTNYYIIPITNKVSENFEYNIIGPLDKIMFERKKAELNIKDIDFDVVYHDLE